MDNSGSLNNVIAPGAAQRQVGAAEQSRNRPDPNTQSVPMSSANMPNVSAAQLAAEVSEEKQQSMGALQSVTESIEEAVEVLNETLSKKLTSAVIRRDEELNRYLVTIKDKNSGEIVREIPDEALLKFARNLEELKGILFDQTL